MASGKRRAKTRLRLPAPNEALRLFEVDVDDEFRTDRSQSVDSSLGVERGEGPRRPPRQPAGR